MMAESFPRQKNNSSVVAFMVDQYLCDNNFLETRSTFRKEASFLISNSSINKMPKNLGEMLEEYICLKEEKVMLDQQRIMVMQEKNRVQMLLQGIQHVMNIYNGFQRPPLPKNANFATVPQPGSCNKTPPGISPIITVNIQSLPKSVNTNTETRNFSAPIINASDKKRKDTQEVNVSTVPKKPRGRPPGRKNLVQGQNTMPPSSNVVNNQVASQPSSTTQSSTRNCVPGRLQIQGYQVSECLFSQPSFPVSTNSPIPKIPSKTHSSHSDTLSPTEISPVATCNGEATPSCSYTITSKKVMVDPAKQMADIESSHCISPVEADTDKASKKECVGNRLDFDAFDMPEIVNKSLPKEISTFESDRKKVDLSKIEFSDLGIDCLFSGIFSDLEMPFDDIDFSNHPAPTHTKDNA